MDNPSHKDKLSNIKRIEGQVKGIAKMIEEERYCIDILNQIKAVKNSISAVERKILQTHLRGCVKNSLDGSLDFDNKVDELMKVLKR